jgi:hypothetical protein
MSKRQPQGEASPTQAASAATAPAGSPPAELSSNGLAQIIAGAVTQGVAAGIALAQQNAPAALAVEHLPPIDPKEVQSELERQLAEPRYLVLISKGDKEALDPVPIGVNGFLRNVKRGEYAVITASMLEVLQNSEETHINPESHEPYQVSAFPYTSFGRVPDELRDMPAADVADRMLPDRRARMH